MLELAVILTVGDSRRELKLLAGGPPIVVGRGADATLRIEEPLFSRRHFELRYDEVHGLEVVDLNSANGTCVNGRMVQRKALRPGDVIRVGQTTIKVDFDAGRPQGWTAAAASGELRCERCLRLISMATVGDDHGLEWGDEVLCGACRDRANVGEPGGLPSLVRALRAEGFEVLGAISPDGAVAPIVRARRLDGSNELVAIKALPLVDGISEKKIERFKAEARSLAHVDHPNVVQVYEVRQVPELIFLVMELIEGQTLLASIEKNGKLPTLEALGVGLAIARALEAVAAQGIVHRNVKPANILLAADGTPKLIDFGIAKGMKPYRLDITSGDEPLGTIRYMAPEQVRDARAADARSDLYALAATLFQALTGKLPYPNHSELTLLQHAVSGKLPDFIIAPTPSIPQPVAHVLMRALKKKPTERYPTPTHFREALVQALYSVTESRGLLSRDELRSIPQSAAAIVDATPGTMRGVFDGEHSLAEILQMLGINSKKGVLTANASGRRGALYFQHGRIIDAQLADVTGEAAAHEILRLPAGEWEFRPALPENLKPRFSRAVEGLVLEALRSLDESRRS